MSAIAHLLSQPLDYKPPKPKSDRAEYWRQRAWRLYHYDEEWREEKKRIQRKYHEKKRNSRVTGADERTETAERKDESGKTA